jgi:Ca2+-binding EF-hand superfamily protein
MLTEETQDILCNLFFILAKGERNIRITRQVISNTFDFSPYHVFNYLANLKTQTITPNDIYDYLNLNDISISENESKLIVLFYDKNFDNALTYEEFYNFIQNDKTNYNCENLVLQKRPQISLNIEFLLLKLFSKEIELAKKAILYLKKLQYRKDFDIHTIFHYITKSSYINVYCMEKFYEKNYNEYLESDIKYMIRRLDINKDGVVDLREFYAILEFPKSCRNYYRFIPCDICKEKNCDKCLYMKDNDKNSDKNKDNIDYKNNFNNINNKYIENNNNKSSYNPRNNCSFHSIRYCPEKNINKDNDNDNNNNNYLSQSQPKFNSRLYLNNLNNNNNNNLYRSQRYKSLYENNNNFEENRKNCFSPIINSVRNKISFLQNKKKLEENPYYKIYPQNLLSPSVKSSYISLIDSYFNFNPDNYNVEKFNDLFKTIMEKEIEIENEKILFMKNTNINIKDIFCFFDQNNKNYISMEDLNNAFNIMEINQNGNEAKLFMNRYDLLKNEKLCQQDFFDAVVPFEKEYRILMENKSYDYIKSDNIFNNKVNFYYMKKLFMVIIDTEYEINRIKKSFYDLEDKINLIFNLIDKDKKGYFSFSDLNTYLQNNKLIFDSYATALLFIRFDKKREGKVEISDIIEEFSILDC